MSVSRSLLALVLLLLSCVLILGFGLWRAEQWKQQADQLAIDVTQAMLGEASADLLAARAHPTLLAAMPATALASYAETMQQRLGQLQAITAIRVDHNLPGALLPGGPEARAAMQIEVQYENSAAEVIIEMMRAPEGWLIEVFRVEAQALFE